MRRSPAGRTRSAPALRAAAGLFGDRLYIELQRHGMPAEQAAEAGADRSRLCPRLAACRNERAVFAAADDYEAHDALLCIAEGRLVADTERRQLTVEHRFKSRAEMAALFADLPEALASTVEIAERCAFRPRTRRRSCRASPPARRMAKASEEAELRRSAEAGFERRLARYGTAPGQTVEDYHERLAFELGVIAKMKYAGYFLIVADFIQWAKSQGHSGRPGPRFRRRLARRLSLTITDLDPIRFGLLFERFLNPERVSMPDFDVDFCQDRRDEVIHYVQEQYGRDQVAQIITFGTLQARGVLRDVGRVLQMPYGQVDKLCKLVPQNPANPVTLERAIEDEPRLQAERDSEPVMRRAFDIAQKLEGLTRHASTHAAGIVIGDRPLTELVPLYRDPKSLMPVTQFNMKWVEPAGLVKFDFLGLKTLTVLDLAVKLVRRRGIDIDLSQPAARRRQDLRDAGTRRDGRRVPGGKAGMRRALIDMRPDRFEDIIALVALYRPGPMANIPTYCARKHGLEQPDYIHPKLEPILRETYGVIIYQEQVMQIAQRARRLLARPSRSAAPRHGQEDPQGDGGAARALHLRRDRARRRTRPGQSDLRPSGAFRRLRFQQEPCRGLRARRLSDAYMKANYPVEFLAASMTLDMGNTDKLSEFRAEAERLGIKVEPPSINRSGVEFDVEGNTIHYALAALRGVGRQAVDRIVAARADRPFADLADFGGRINPRAINKRVLESLAAAGAFDAIEPNRARGLRRGRYAAGDRAAHPG